MLQAPRLELAAAAELEEVDAAERTGTRGYSRDPVVQAATREKRLARQVVAKREKRAARAADEWLRRRLPVGTRVFCSFVGGWWGGFVLRREADDPVAVLWDDGEIVGIPKGDLATSPGGRPRRDGPSTKARTPRALAPPPPGPLDMAPAAALAKAHGGINFAAPPARGGAARRWHALGVRATSVLMGYDADRFSRAPGLVNDPAASWRLLGNTVQRDVLASIAAPFIEALKASLSTTPSRKPRKKKARRQS